MNLIDAMLAMNSGNTVRLRSFVYRKRSCESERNVIEMKFVEDDEHYEWNDFYLLDEEITSKEWSIFTGEEKVSEDTKKECDCECMENIKGFSSIFLRFLLGDGDVSASDYKYFRRELRLLG